MIKIFVNGHKVLLEYLNEKSVYIYIYEIPSIVLK